MLLTLKDFKQADDARVTYLLEYVDFLEDLASRVLVLDVDLVDALDGHILARELVDAERDLAEGSLAEQLDEPIEVQGRRRYLVVLFHIGANVAYKLVTILGHLVIEHDFLRFVSSGTVSCSLHFSARNDWSDGLFFMSAATMSHLVLYFLHVVDDNMAVLGRDSSFLDRLEFGVVHRLSDVRLLWTKTNLNLLSVEL